MGWTKRQFVEQAFSEIGLAGYVFDLQPEQLQTVLRQLDSMMATWNGKGIKVGYPLSTTPGGSDLDEETSVSMENNEAIYLNLAIRIASSFGKTPSPETKSSAKMAFDAIALIAAIPAEQQFPGTTPAGAGNKPWRRYDDSFLRRPDTHPLDTQEGDQLILRDN